MKEIIAACMACSLVTSTPDFNESTTDEIGNKIKKVTSLGQDVVEDNYLPKVLFEYLEKNNRCIKKINPFTNKKEPINGLYIKKFCI